LAGREADSAGVPRVSARYTAVQARSANEAFQLSLGSVEGESPGQGASPGLASSLLPDDALGGVLTEPANCNDTGSQIEGSPTDIGQNRRKSLWPVSAYKIRGNAEISAYHKVPQHSFPMRPYRAVYPMPSPFTRPAHAPNTASHDRPAIRARQSDPIRVTALSFRHPSGLGWGAPLILCHLKSILFAARTAAAPASPIGPPMMVAAPMTAALLIASFPATFTAALIGSSDCEAAVMTAAMPGTKVVPGIPAAQSTFLIC